MFSLRTFGFTAIEMMVSVAVIAIIAGIVVANHGAFRDSIETTNLAYEVALGMREAQVLAMSVREYSGSMVQGYGLHFDKTKPQEFILFIDGSPGDLTVSDKKYTSAMDDPIVQTYRLRRGNVIKEACVIRSGVNNSCFIAGPPPFRINFLDITFKRPQSDASFWSDCGHPTCSPPPWISGEITLQSLQGVTKKILITNTGQISVQ